MMRHLRHHPLQRALRMDVAHKVYRKSDHLLLMYRGTGRGPIPVELIILQELRRVQRTMQPLPILTTSGRETPMDAGALLRFLFPSLLIPQPGVRSPPTKQFAAVAIPLL